MGANHSREDLLSDSDTDSEQESDSQTPEVRREEDDSFEDARATPSPMGSKTPNTPSSLEQVESKLKALKLMYNKKSDPAPKNVVKLFRHVGGMTTNSKWVVVDKCAAYSFVKTQSLKESDDCIQLHKRASTCMRV